MRVIICYIYLCLQCYVCLYCFLGYKRIVRCKYLWNVQYNEHWLIAQMLCMQFIVTRPWCDVKISTPCKHSEIVEISAIIFPFRLPIWIKCENDVFHASYKYHIFLHFIIIHRSMYVHPLIKMICPKDPQQALLSNVPMCFYIIDLMQNRTLIIPKLL